jgi:hypothetical protein
MLPVKPALRYIMDATPALLMWHVPNAMKDITSKMDIAIFAQLETSFAFFAALME